MNRSSSFPSVASALFWVGSRPAPVALRTSLQSAFESVAAGNPITVESLCDCAKKKNCIDSKPDGSIWLSRLVPPKKRKDKKGKKCCIMPGACRGGSGGGESVCLCVKGLGEKKKTRWRAVCRIHSVPTPQGCKAHS